MFLQWLSDLVYQDIVKYAKTENFKYGIYEVKLLLYLSCY